MSTPVENAKPCVTLSRDRLATDYAVRFTYDPYIAGVLKKTVTSSERRFDADERRWYVAASAVDRLAFALRARGCEVRFEHEPYRT
ncbi:hypothetical protein [Nocardia wallacei]|uniref:hypothetical protein n=1 Tax=Nocardia wallacei TaxID=480035 RepID=UPI00245386C5|nr:hypothetical protein [Nocardia wallacei]